MFPLVFESLPMLSQNSLVCSELSLYFCLISDFSRCGQYLTLLPLEKIDFLAKQNESLEETRQLTCKEAITRERKEIESNVVMGIYKSKDKTNGQDCPELSNDSSCYLCCYHYGGIQSPEAIMLLSPTVARTW